MTIDTDRTLSVTVLYLNYQSSHPLPPKFGLVATQFLRANNLVSKQDDKLSEQKFLRESPYQCGNRNSIFDYGISLNKRHNTNRATSIHENKCYVTLPYYGELSKK